MADVTIIIDRVFGRIQWGRPTGKTYESNFIHHDFFDSKNRTRDVKPSYVQAIPLVEFRAFLTRWLVQRLRDE